MVIREQEPLCRHTTLRTGGPACFFAEAATESEIREAIGFARERRLPVFVLGAGSNVLARDEGYPGLVLRLAGRGLDLRATPDGGAELVAEAGTEWDAAVAFAVERSLFGLENMSLIPGTVGAAVAGNIGAYGAEIKDTLLWVEALDLPAGGQRRFGVGECQFQYRHSFFKTPLGRQFVITRAAFGLKRNGLLNTRYQDVRDFFAAQDVTAPTLADMRNAVVTIRRRKMPDMERVGTAGSFFKNPVIAREQHEALVRRFPGLPGHNEANGRIKVPLGWILDKVCGLRGVRKGRVGTHAEQALVIVNEGGTAAEVEAFARETARLVLEKTGIQVEWEVERL
jgi:UDP-N-acetylmuramate dehydrogenase